MTRLYKNEGWKTAMRTTAHLVQRHGDQRSHGVYWVELDPDAMHDILDELEEAGRLLERLSECDSHTPTEFLPSVLNVMKEAKQFTGHEPAYQNYEMSYEATIPDDLAADLKRTTHEEHRRAADVLRDSLFSTEAERVFCICNYVAWGEVNPETQEMIKTHSKIEINDDCAIHGSPKGERYEP